MKGPKKVFPRLWALLASESNVGVIFRRGPSRQVRLIKWDTQNDTFELGQWLKGRIYERRCDLSPDGKFLVYFASKPETPLGTWTAISKPPYLTALALWEKGDCWNGGGWFVGHRLLRLNHLSGDRMRDDSKASPIQIVGYAEAGGEDDSVWDITRARDGWIKTQEGKETYLVHGWRCNPPETWKKFGGPKSKFILEMAIIGIGGQNIPWYQIKYRVLLGPKTVLDLGKLDWADWDRRGDLVFAQNGCIYRQHRERLEPGAAVKIADLNEMKFESIVAPDWAQRWA